MNKKAAKRSIGQKTGWTYFITVFISGGAERVNSAGGRTARRYHTGVLRNPRRVNPRGLTEDKQGERSFRRKGSFVIAFIYI